MSRITEANRQPAVQPELQPEELAAQASLTGARAQCSAPADAPGNRVQPFTAGHETAPASRTDELLALATQVVPAAFLAHTLDAFFGARVSTEAAPKSPAPAHVPASAPEKKEPATATARPAPKSEHKATKQEAAKPFDPAKLGVPLKANEAPARAASRELSPLTAAKHGVVVPEERRQPTVDLKLRPQAQKGGTDCCITAKAMVTTGFGVSSFAKLTEKRMHVATGEDRQGRLEIDPAAMKAARQAMDAALDAGQPVLAGVSHSGFAEGSAYNDDKLTDHFVTITGRDHDKEGRLFYTFNDPAEGNVGRFYVDSETGRLFKEGHNDTTRVAVREYEVAQLRTYSVTPPAQHTAQKKVA